MLLRTTIIVGVGCELPQFDNNCAGSTSNCLWKTKRHLIISIFFNQNEYRSAFDSPAAGDFHTCWSKKYYWWLNCSCFTTSLLIYLKLVHFPCRQTLLNSQYLIFNLIPGVGYISTDQRRKQFACKSKLSQFRDFQEEWKNDIYFRQWLRWLIRIFFRARRIKKKCWDLD